MKIKKLTRIARINPAEAYSKDLRHFQTSVDVNAFNSIEDAETMLYILNAPI